MSRSSRTQSTWAGSPRVRGLTLAILAIVALFGREWLADFSVDAGADGTVEALFEDGRSGEMVVISATVDRLLSDDNDGSRHQRFIVRLESGHTLLVAHNIDLAERVPLTAGDRVTMRGEYEWNEQGGVIHWTHHDPRGSREGGWIDAGGERYR